jgi:dTDP-4-dehydrorhamnose 3,5-epimerase
LRRFAIADTPIAGVRLIDREVMRDDRGHFARLFCVDELAEAGWPSEVVQINESWTARRGSVRGMHFQQPPFGDAKLVTCIRGAVRDIALDLRAGSSTLLQWHGETLSAENGRALLIPVGCAHGFQTLSDDVLLIYCHSRRYTPSADAGINPLDPRAAIDWQLPIVDMSERDRHRPMLPESFAGVQF